MTSPKKMTTTVVKGQTEDLREYTIAIAHFAVLTVWVTHSCKAWNYLYIYCSNFIHAKIIVFLGPPETDETTGEKPQPSS